MKKTWYVWLIAFVSLNYGMTASKKFVQIFLPNGKTITAELAVSDHERARGLMFREKLNSDEGMLFVFEEESYHSFWMKNMIISLDLLWLNRDKLIVHMEENVPPCKEDPCPSYAPRIGAMYVLELRAGSVAENGLEVSDKVNFILE